MRLRVTFALLILLALVGGSVNRAPRNSVAVERFGYRVLEADFHVHSHAGDGILSPFGIVLFAQNRQLDVIAITDHNQVYGAKAARWFSRLIGGPTVLVGEEITAPDYHLLAIGIEERVPWQQTAAESIRTIQNQGGIAIAAHPGRHSQPAFQNVIKDLHGSEVVHAHNFANLSKAAEMIDFYERNRNDLTAIGSSDYHWFNALGIGRTYVFVKNNDEREIIDAIRSGRTVVYDAQGNAYGDPQLIQSLQNAPIASDTVDYVYAGSGVFDVITRTFGWIGVLGLLIFGRRPRPR